MQQDIADLLQRIAPPGAFAVERSAPAEALRIEVEGVGPLDLPLSPATVSKLRSVAKPSRYGLRDRTVFDTRVRNSREIARRRIRIEQPRWNTTLIPLLEDIRAGLGLAEGATLKAQLHNMLLYERGDFFVPHQDSEKDDGMIGTLVVTLPSSFRGGEMTIEQHGEVMAFRGSRTALQLIAFYADCRHEVRPVTGGARVVLTYNLLTAGVARAMPARIEPSALDALTAALQRHFETPPAGRSAARPLRPTASPICSTTNTPHADFDGTSSRARMRRARWRCRQRANGSTARSFWRRPTCTRRGNARAGPTSGTRTAAGRIAASTTISTTTSTTMAEETTPSRSSRISSTATSSCETLRLRSHRPFATKSFATPARPRR